MYSPTSADDGHNQVGPKVQEEEEDEEGVQQKEEDEMITQQINQEHPNNQHTTRNKKELKQELTKTPDGPSSSSNDEDEDATVYAKYLTGLEMPHFIFHAAGHCAKLEALKGMSCPFYFLFVPLSNPMIFINPPHYYLPLLSPPSTCLTN